MKIVRKEFIGEITNKVVITENATNNTWRKLIESARNKTSFTKYGIPQMTVWKNKFVIYTKTGNSFQFEFLK